MQRHLVIVDGHHLLYRAYWAIPRTLCTSRGEQVNTAFGVGSMLLQILKVEEPTHLLFCFDADEQTFRHAAFAEYKAGRAATPDDFYPQVPRALELLDAFRIQSVSGGAYEADDFACSYARAAEARGDRVTIVTGDRDLLQLASDAIRIAIPHKGYQSPEYMTPAAVQEKYGVTPAQIPSYKGLVGDASDNLRGVDGIGPKTAAILLQRYGSLETLYAHVDDVKPGWRDKLLQGKEQAFFCRKMAELVCDIPLTTPLDSLAFVGIPAASVRETLQKYEFSLVARRFESLLTTPYGKRVFSQEGAVVSPASTPPQASFEQMSFLV